jgi:DNA polymerase-1
MKNKKIIVFDSDAVCWNVFHALPAGLSANDKGTAVIYGFLSKILDIQEYEKADRIVFAWDSRKSNRVKLFPDYKKKRREKKKEYTEDEIRVHQDRARQFKLLRTEILPTLGFKNIFMEEGFEGDDIIASVALKYRKENYVKIIARDADLYQLITETCVIFDIKTRVIVDEQAFYEKYSFYPDMFADVKGLSGCTTDEVPGIKGVGDATAAKFLCNNMKDTSVIYKRIKESKDTIKLTRKLVVLPFKGTPKYKLKKDKCTMSKFNRIIKEYNLNSFRSRNRKVQFKEGFVNGK